MQYRYLGKSGLEVSALSLGAWVTFGDQVGEEVAYQSMRKLAMDTNQKIAQVAQSVLHAAEILGG